MNINNISQRLSEKLPNLGEELKNAYIEKGVVEYLSEAIWKSILFSILIFVFESAITIQNPKPLQNIVFTTISFCFLMYLYLNKPKTIMNSRAYRIEKSLIFSLEAVNIEVNSGIKFGNALENVADRDYGEFSKEMRRVMDETRKIGLKEALEASAKRNPSKMYRRALWMITNSLETGAEISENLKSVIQDLKHKQEIEAQRYGNSIAKQMMFYSMGAIVLPALAFVILQSLTTLGLSAKLNSAIFYYIILIVSVTVQIIFLYIIKFKKPTLLRMSLNHKNEKITMKKHIESLISYSGSEMGWQTWISTRIIYSLLMGVLVSIPLSRLSGIDALVIAVSVSVFAFITFYTWLGYKADTRGMAAAEYLPDALRMMSSNIQAGMTIDEALFMSARPEFGVLCEEIRKLSTDMIKNFSFEQALEKLKTRIKSDYLEMSINLISHGIKAGSGVADSLKQVAKVLQDREYIKQNIQTQMYQVMVSVALLIVLICPILYSASITSGTIMRHLMNKLTDEIPQKVVEGGFIKMGQSSSGVSLEFIDNFILFNIFVTSVLGSMIIGELGTGRVMDGLKYTLFIVITSEFIYLAAKTLLIEEVIGAFA